MKERDIRGGIAEEGEGDHIVVVTYDEIYCK